MPENINLLLKDYRKDITKIVGDKLRNIILYGSYARGDFTEDSDLDIMILADVEPEQISHYATQIYDMTYDYEMQYGLEVNPSIQSTQIYDKWKKAYPFFINIEKEGIEV